MTPLLRSRVARIVLIGAFVIPFGTSSLRGLTHVLTCGDEIETPFTIAVPEEGEPTVTTSLRLARESSEPGCRSVSVNLGARFNESGDVELVVPVSNNSDVGWRGTVQLDLGDRSVPVDIGAVGPDETASDSLALRLPPGTTELNGTLLIGP